METPTKLLTLAEKAIRYQGLRHEFQNQSLYGLLNPVNDLTDRNKAEQLKQALKRSMESLRSVSAWERDLHTSNMMYMLLSGVL